MADLGSLLQQMMEAAARNGRGGLRTGGAPAEPGAGATPSDLGGLGGLSDLLKNVLAGAGQPGGRAPPGGGSLESSISDILKDFSGGQESPGAIGDARSPLPDQGKSFPPQPDTASRAPDGQGRAKDGMGDLMRHGGIAVLGTIAYTAFEQWQAQQAAQGSPTTNAAAGGIPQASGFHPAQAPGGPDVLADVLLKAMIAAAQSDGAIDEGEQKQIIGRLDQIGMSPEDRRDLAQQLTTRIPMREITSLAASPEMALQIYAASTLAVAVDTPAERRYLDQLASELGIEPSLKQQIEHTLGRA